MNFIQAVGIEVSLGILGNTVPIPKPKPSKKEFRIPLGRLTICHEGRVVDIFTCVRGKGEMGDYN
mgnify:CR=1 FL=1